MPHGTMKIRTASIARSHSSGRELSPDGDVLIARLLRGIADADSELLDRLCELDPRRLLILCALVAETEKTAGETRAWLLCNLPIFE